MGLLTGIKRSYNQRKYRKAQKTRYEKLYGPKDYVKHRNKQAKKQRKKKVF